MTRPHISSRERGHSGGEGNQGQPVRHCKWQRSTLSKGNLISGERTKKQGQEIRSGFFGTFPPRLTKNPDRKITFSSLGIRVKKDFPAGAFPPRGKEACSQEDQQVIIHEPHTRKHKAHGKKIWIDRVSRLPSGSSATATPPDRPGRRRAAKASRVPGQS